MNFSLTYYWFFVVLPIAILEIVWGLYMLFTARQGMTGYIKSSNSDTVRNSPKYSRL